MADPDDLPMWEALCPNPACLLNLPDDRVAYTPPDKAAIHQKRRRHFAGNLSLTYAEPVMLLRGWRHHMFDEWGRTYLDAYNNVPHVGHAHPRIQAVACEQLGRINSNTRYLHPAQTAFADKLGKTPITVADRPGFLVNRLLMAYLNEALLLCGEGYDWVSIDMTSRGSVCRWGLSA